MKKQFNYSVSGIIRDSYSGKALSKLKVRAFDKDFFRDQLLGDGISDENGRYEIKFNREDFTGPIIKLERHPDIFVLVYDENDNLVYSTEKSVIIDAGRHTTLDLNIPFRGHIEDLKEVSNVLGMPVNMKYVSRLSTKDLVNAYKLLRYPAMKVENLELIKKAFPTFLHKHDIVDDCGEGMEATFRLLLKERNAEADINDADNYAPGTTIHNFYTANTLTAYTLDAGNADQLPAALSGLPAADQNYNFPGAGGQLIGVIRANLADLQTVNPLNTEVAPTYVQQIGLMAEYALSHYLNAQFAFQDPRGGAALFEMRLKTQAGTILGQTTPSWNYVEVGFSDTDPLHFGTVPHEMFHQVQYRYNPTLFVAGGIYGILREGGARLIEDCIYDAPNRYISSASSDGLFSNPNNSLIDTGGARTPIRYAAGLFWKYFAEHHSPNTNPANEPAVGIETYRFLLEEAGGMAAGYAIQAVRNARNRMPWYGTFDQFSYYDMAATELGSNETTYGNYLLANYLHRLLAPGDADYDQRFDYLEDDEATGPTVLNAQSVATETITIGQGAAVTRNIAAQNPYAAKYYTITPDAMSLPRMLRVNFSATVGLTDPVVQIIRLGAGDTLVDIHRSDKTNYSKTINMAGLSKVIVIIGSKENGGDFTIHFDEQASASDVMVTRWNSRVGTEYEVDPKGWAWTWISPDIMVDTNNDGLDDVNVIFGQNNTLKVRLRNRGNLNVNNIQIDFWYQKATPYLSAAAWIPVQNMAMVTQQLTMQTLNAGSDNWFAVDWCPIDDGTHHNHWCVKAVVTCSGDPNTDNKMAFRNFNNVAEADMDHDFNFTAMLRFAWPPKEQMIHIIPRSKNWNLSLNNPDVLPTGKTNQNHDAYPHQLRLAVPDDLGFAKLKVAKADLNKWDGKNTRIPQETGAYYPVDPLTLPPGIKANEVITVAHIANGKVIGGVSYKISSHEK
ncbi:MAG: hypothetical protein H7246_19100 [Phycisphaerae bacterium]|nr:hypothetical protein [Saprospiraceae bacterium]